MRRQLLQVQAVHELGRECEQTLQLIDVRYCWIKSAYSSCSLLMSATVSDAAKRVHQGAEFTYTPFVLSCNC